MAAKKVKAGQQTRRKVAAKNLKKEGSKREGGREQEVDENKVLKRGKK